MELYQDGFVVDDENEGLDDAEGSADDDDREAEDEDAVEPDDMERMEAEMVSVIG